MCAATLPTASAHRQPVLNGRDMFQATEAFDQCSACSLGLNHSATSHTQPYLLIVAAATRRAQLVASASTDQRRRHSSAPINNNCQQLT